MAKARRQLTGRTATVAGGSATAGFELPIATTAPLAARRATA
jgi:hypothetical protein